MSAISASDEADCGLVLVARLLCPECGHRWREEMPENVCIQHTDCPACGFRLTPRKGDCCVYCSHADYPCPPVQKTGRSCCGGN